MTVYLDTSAMLRVLFHEANPIRIWGQWSQAYSSSLLRVEAFRAVDRLRLKGKLTDLEVASLATDIQIVRDTLVTVPLNDSILRRASEAFPTTVGTLDALHLATALAVREFEPLDLLLTHDHQLGVAARSLGFTVQGIEN
ncbi:MAG TPA: type II toxin-antitoxin system VapC family toxin [Acidobacteriota bacterium]|jgi:predicted nucleic acid-binding protein